MRAALLAVLLLAGCAATTERGCYVGFNLIPPSPVVICGVDFGAREAD